MDDRDSGDLFGALILITLGTVFLLMNFGYLSWELWGEIWKLWPLILIFAGLGYFFGKDKWGVCNWVK